MAVLRKRYLKAGNRYVWVVDYRWQGERHVRSTGTSDRKAAETILKNIEVTLALGRFGLEKAGPKSLLLSDFIESFLTYSKTNKARRTWQGDRDSLNSFRAFAGDVLLSTITPEIVEQFKADRLQTIRPTSVNVALRHLKSAFSIAMKWGHLAANPFQPVKLLKIPKRTPYFLSRDEIHRLLHTIEQANEHDFHRLIRFYLLSGVRHQEALRLRWQDVDTNREIITVIGKGGKERAIPFNEGISEVLNSLPRDSEFLFPSVRTGGQREYFWVSKKFRKYADQAGLPKATLHTLRHTFASHLIMNGGDLAALQELLGHASITTTMIYVHLLDDHRRKAIEKVTY